MNKIYIKDIIKQTMADGPGLRTSIYCSGCYHHCPGCHNPQTWDLFSGKEIDIEDLVDLADDKYIDGITFTGGDPLYQVEGFTELAKRIKEKSKKSIWLYTGFTMEEILNQPRLSQILRYVDYVVDGPFIESKRNLDLKFRGSSNQKIWRIMDRFPILDTNYLLDC
jgi:anaerobic ribonucleoside-triphosphate reductase activating protein